MPSYRPLGVAAARLFARRWPLYAGTCAVVFALEALFYTFVHVRLAEYYAALIGAPLISVVVMVNAGADATGTLASAAERWTRIVERGWAIVVLDVGITFVELSGLQTMGGGTLDPGTTLLGLLALFLAAMLVYAEPFACLERDVTTLMVLPFALMRSMILSWVNVSRIFSLFAIQLALNVVDLLLVRGLAAAGIKDATMIDMLFWTLITAPLAILFTVAYLDTLAQERSATE